MSGVTRTRIAAMKRQLTEDLRRCVSPTDEDIRRMIGVIIERERETSYFSLSERRETARELFDSVRGLDILQELLEDAAVTEIMVNGPDAVFIEKNGCLERWPKTFASREKLEDVVRRIVGACNRVVNERQPIADARLPDGSRVNAVISPAAPDGPVLTIRRFPDTPMTMAALIGAGSLTAEAAACLEDSVRRGRSILVSGGTGAGKTTFLNAMSAAIPPNERVVSIEDNAELCLASANLVRLEARDAAIEGGRSVTLRDLIRTALRMRPDRIIVGEVLGEEVCDLLQAVNTGHRGSMSTIHANSAGDTLIRLETLVMTGMAIPLPAIRRQIASGIELIVHLTRRPSGRRLVSAIAEIDGMDGDEIALRPLYRLDDEDRLIRCL